MYAIQKLVVHSEESDMFGSRTRFETRTSGLCILPGFADRLLLTAAALSTLRWLHNNHGFFFLF